METNTTSESPTALTIARNVLLTVALSALSANQQIFATSARKRFEVAITAASTPEDVDPALVEQMSQIFKRGASEFFEDGRDSNFARELMLAVIEHGNAAIGALAGYLFSSTANADVGSEALRRLADLKDRRILSSRWALLQHSLKHRSPRVRDGAILGFASLDDHRALEVLKEVEADEPLPELQKLVQKVIRQLGMTNGETAAQS